MAAFQIGFIRAKGFHKGIAWLVLATVPFATQSTGGIVVTLVIVLICLYSRAKQLGKQTKVHPLTIVTFFSVAILLCVLAIIDANHNMSLFSSLLQSQNSVLQRWQANSMDGRFERYLFTVKNFSPHLIGCGYTLIHNGIVIFPHSDHLRFLYAYGAVPYICLLKMIGSNVKLKIEYIFMIPALIAFTINSVIDEPRFMYTFAVLFAISMVSIQKDEQCVAQ